MFSWTFRQRQTLGERHGQFQTNLEVPLLQYSNWPPSAAKCTISRQLLRISPHVIYKTMFHTVFCKQRHHCLADTSFLCLPDAFLRLHVRSAEKRHLTSCWREQNYLSRAKSEDERTSTREPVPVCMPISCFLTVESQIPGRFRGPWPRGWAGKACRASCSSQVGCFCVMHSRLECITTGLVGRPLDNLPRRYEAYTSKGVYNYYTYYSSLSQCFFLHYSRIPHVI